MPRELRATYRVQLHADFGFDAAAAIADYLAELGVSHLYCSPYLQAVKGSKHGYDIVNHSRVNDELGGEEGLARFCRRLQKCGLGQVLDIVPNHMAIPGRENEWWWDVLENGPASRYAPCFDVDWDPPEAKLRNTVLLPVLGDHYGRILEAGELRLGREAGTFTIGYKDREFPVAPRSLDDLLAAAAERCQSADLAFIADAFGWLPPATATDWASVQRRHRDKEVLRVMLARLCEEQPPVRAAIDSVIAEINGDADAMDRMLDRQNYRLAFWRTAGRELGYRRFFDINTLIGLRVEDRRVFAATHMRIIEWLNAGLLDGLRVDHPDGLRDPESYFRALREAAPGAWIVAEKILEPGEALRESWPVAGTTGYDFLNRVNGLFVNPGSAEPLSQFYTEFTGEPADTAALHREKKHLVMRDMLGSDVNRLTALLIEVCERHRRHRDYTRHDLHEALRELVANFPVYRTYVRAEAERAGEDDVRYLEEALESAKSRRADLDPNLFDFLGDLILLRLRGDLESEFVMRFQQLTGPVMAKGVEDTAFYCFNRLVSLNEVGGSPGRFGIAVEEFHRLCTASRERWPRSMLATSTHDTKRSEDVRARISLLSEIPERWTAAVRRWSARNETHRRHDFPDRNAEYLLYQTLVGAWPIEVERVTAYMEKASREAKVFTTWTESNAAYDEALRGFVEAIMADETFMADLQDFVAPLVEPGRINSLAQTLIKLTTPGIPDLYQGTELWDLSLVDPDNRRPVDYQLRRRLLAELKDLGLETIWDRIDEGLPKLWVIRQALKLRRGRPELFGPDATYRPLNAMGAKAAHAVAFARGEGAVTVSPRFVIGLGGRWEDTALEIPSGRWRNELAAESVAGGIVSLAELLKRFPVALLSRQEN